MTHTVKEMCKTCGITPRTFYRLANEDETFAQVVESNRVKVGNATTYREPVLTYLKKRYCEEAEIDDMHAEAPDAPVEPSDTQGGEIQPDDTRAALEREIDALTAKLRAEEQKSMFLAEKVASLQEDKATLNAQFSNVLFLFTQEKAEKQRLLPAPKKPFMERLKEWAKKRKLPE